MNIEKYILELNNEKMPLIVCERECECKCIEQTSENIGITLFDVVIIGDNTYSLIANDNFSDEVQTQEDEQLIDVSEDYVTCEEMLIELISTYTTGEINQVIKMINSLVNCNVK